MSYNSENPRFLNNDVAKTNQRWMNQFCDECIIKLNMTSCPCCGVDPWFRKQVKSIAENLCSATCVSLTINKTVVFSKTCVQIDPVKSFVFRLSRLIKFTLNDGPAENLREEDRIVVEKLQSNEGFRMSCPAATINVEVYSLKKLDESIDLLVAALLIYPRLNNPIEPDFHERNIEDYSKLFMIRKF